MMARKRSTKTAPPAATLTGRSMSAAIVPLALYSGDFSVWTRNLDLPQASDVDRALFAAAIAQGDPMPCPGLPTAHRCKQYCTSYRRQHRRPQGREPSHSLAFSRSPKAARTEAPSAKRIEVSDWGPYAVSIRFIPRRPYLLAFSDCPKLIEYPLQKAR